MTNKQINAAIAEACGWVPDCDRGICWDQHGTAIITPPNYCTDLNAMHEAEMVLTKEQVREYHNYMYDMACEIKNTCGRWMPYSATAHQRAEAFLKTLGKLDQSGDATEMMEVQK